MASQSTWSQSTETDVAMEEESRDEEMEMEMAPKRLQTQGGSPCP
jgi:hypothetical protein